MDLYGSHFTYANVSSRTYNLIFANISTERFVNINGATSSITIFNKRENKNLLIGDSFEDFPVSFDVEIVTDDQEPIPVSTMREIEHWLFNRKSYAKLYQDELDDTIGAESETVNGVTVHNYYNCRFLNPEKLEYNGGVIGFKATMECDSGLAWQDAVSSISNLNLTSSSSSSTFSITADSDMNEYIYPKVTITMGAAGGDISIINLTDDDSRITKFISLTGEIELVMNGSLNYISGSNYIKFQNKNFIRMLPGENRFSVVGAIQSIKFEWQNRRYM